MTEPFTITVPGPLGENLGQNAHVHWRVRAAATKQARAVWWACAWDAFHEPNGLDGMRLTFNAYFCRKRGGTAGYRPRDYDNLIAAMKPSVDGLIDAGLCADDDKTRVRYGDHEITWVDTFGEERVTIHVEPLLGGKG